jgi:hypothetical protein
MPGFIARKVTGLGGNAREAGRDDDRPSALSDIVFRIRLRSTAIVAVVYGSEYVPEAKSQIQGMCRRNEINVMYMKICQLNFGPVRVHAVGFIEFIVQDIQGSFGFSNFLVVRVEI